MPFWMFSVLFWYQILPELINRKLNIKVKTYLMVTHILSVIFLPVLQIMHIWYR